MLRHEPSQIFPVGSTPPGDPTNTFQNSKMGRRYMFLFIVCIFLTFIQPNTCSDPQRLSRYCFNGGHSAHAVTHPVCHAPGSVILILKTDLAECPPALRCCDMNHNRFRDYCPHRGYLLSVSGQCDGQHQCPIHIPELLPGEPNCHPNKPFMRILYECRTSFQGEVKYGIKRVPMEDA